MQARARRLPKLVEKYHMAHISTGDILRAAVKNQTELGLEAKKYMDAGDLVPDELVIGLVKERLQDEDTQAGFILDGFPRTSMQAVALDSELAELNRPLDAAVLVDVDKEVIIKRFGLLVVCAVIVATLVLTKILYALSVVARCINAMMTMRPLFVIA